MTPMTATFRLRCSPVMTCNASVHAQSGWICSQDRGAHSEKRQGAHTPCSRA